jgi:hypothetical protein
MRNADRPASVSRRYQVVDGGGDRSRRAEAGQRNCRGDAARLERIITRCLRKDPGRRFQTAADLRVALQEVKEESESGKFALAAVPTSLRRHVSAPLIAVSGALLVALAMIAWFLSRTPPKPTAGVVITRLTSDSGLTTEPSISPDGKLVAYASDRSGEDNPSVRSARPVIRPQGRQAAHEATEPPSLPRRFFTRWSDPHANAWRLLRKTSLLISLHV